MFPSETLVSPPYLPGGDPVSHTQQPQVQFKHGLNMFFLWNIWLQPIGFMVFLISYLAECERLPFDLPEVEEELVAGY